MKDHTLEVLKEIRAELGGFRKDVNERFERVDQRLERVEGRVERVEHRLTESETRVATELVAVASAVREVRDVLLEDRALRAQVLDHEQRLTKLERRAG